MKNEDLEEVLIDEVNLEISRDLKRWEIFVGNHKKYKFFAYPGPEASSEGKKEHKPYHIHIKYSGGREIGRFNLETLEPMRYSKDFSKELRKYLEENWEELLKKTKSVYHTGKVF